MTKQERLRSNLNKQVGRSLVAATWQWKAMNFRHFGWFGTEKASAFIEFTASFSWMKVKIERDDRYGLPDVEKTFTGDNALSDAVGWTVDRLVELHEIVEERTAPYIGGKVAYERALKGDI